MTTDERLRDPRTFLVGDRPGVPGAGIHFPSSDEVLAAIYRGDRPGDTLTDDEMEHYYPGDIILGRVPLRAVSVLLGRGQLVEVEAALAVEATVGQPRSRRAARGGGA